MLVFGIFLYDGFLPWLVFAWLLLGAFAYA